MNQGTLFEASMMDVAMDIAQRAHFGQVRRGDRSPYITHPVRVRAIAARFGYSKIVQVTAIVHDSVEDSQDPDATSREIKAKLPAIHPIVVSMTHAKGTPYLDYVVGMEGETLQAKLSDMLHNLMDGPSPRQRQKYKRALAAIFDRRGGPPTEIHPAHWAEISHQVGFDPERIGESLLREFISGTLVNVV